MGFFKAIGKCYVGMLDFGGRAPRSEFWWFYLFQWLFFWAPYVIAYQLSPIALPEGDKLLSDAAFEAWLTRSMTSEAFLKFFAYLMAIQFFFYFLPTLAVTVRRLHDTDHSGWWMFKPFLLAFVANIGLALLAGMSGAPNGRAAVEIVGAIIYAIAWIWYIVVLASRGSHGNNRFGPDPIPGAKRKRPDHPAFAQPANEADRADLEAQRRAEMREYYKKNVLNGIQRS